MWEIVANKSIGPYLLDSNIEMYMHSLGEYRKLNYTSDTEDTTYSFKNAGVSIEVNSKGNIKSITVIPPNEIYFLNIKFMGNRFEISIEDLKNEFLKNSIAFKELPTGLWLEESSISLVDYEGYVHGIELFKKD